MNLTQLILFPWSGLPLLARDNADWFIHQVMSAIIHGAVYGTLFHVFKGLGLGGSIVASLAILVVSWLLYSRLLRRR